MLLGLPHRPERRSFAALMDDAARIIAALLRSELDNDLFHRATPVLGQGR
jgi:hypothetical protein